MHKNIQQSTCREDYEGVVSLATILMQLHDRYELGLIPPAVDGKRHELKVVLTRADRGTHGVRLRYRPEYIPVREEPEWAQ
jgi:hypothetical protein